MHARLFSRSGTFNGQSFEIEGDTTIGRSDRNRIVLKSRTISSEHARIFPDEEGEVLLLEDLGSLNGTFIDGIRVRGAERLGALHVITFAENADFVFRLGDAPVENSAETLDETLGEAATPLWPENALEDSAPSQAPETLGDEEELVAPDVSLELAEEAPATTPSRLVVKAGDHELTLGEGEHEVGRGEENALQLEQPSVSRRHAALRWLDGRVSVRDLGSSNGTFVNGVKIEADTELVLPCEVTFGAVDVALSLEGE